VLSGRGLCDGLITHPEESYRMCCSLCVILKPREWGGPGPLGDCCAKKENYGKGFWSKCEHHGIFISCCTTVSLYIYFLNKGKFLDVNASVIQHSHRFVHEFTKAKYSQMKCTYTHDLYCGKVFKTHWFLDFSIFQKSKQNTLWKADLFVVRRLLNMWIAVFSSIQDDELCPEIKQTEV
jgi:hypothetical protein